ncbi:MAG: WxL domain-containing protein [Lactobacillales bacterium]|jgi:hypothetical protein|nr:WxL domain-containing protein [Lactobacillales bacterium]
MRKLIGLLLMILTFGAVPASAETVAPASDGTGLTNGVVDFLAQARPPVIMPGTQADRGDNAGGDNQHFYVNPLNNTYLDNGFGVDSSFYIQHLPSFDFGEVQIDNKDTMTLYSKYEALGAYSTTAAASYMTPFIQVVDLQANMTNWTLSVSQSSNQTLGTYFQKANDSASKIKAQITFSDYKLFSDRYIDYGTGSQLNTLINPLIQGYNGELTLTGTPQVIFKNSGADTRGRILSLMLGESVNRSSLANASVGKESSKYEALVANNILKSVYEANPTRTQSAKLVVPNDQIITKGNYKTDLTWTLSITP